MEYSGIGKSIELDNLQREYDAGLFRRIPSSEKHTMLSLGDGTTIGMLSCLKLKTEDRL
jgi:hypothetical protein